MSNATDSCAGFDELLLDFAYGELEAVERRSVESHLSGCERCRSELDAMMGTRRLMQALEPDPAPADGLESLLAYAERAAARTEAEAPRRPWTRWLVPVLPLGGLLIAVLTVVGRDPDPAAVVRAPSREVAQVVEVPGSQKAEAAGLAQQISPAPPAGPAEFAAPNMDVGGGLAEKSRVELDEGGGGGHVDDLRERRREFLASRPRKAARESTRTERGMGSFATGAAGSSSGLLGLGGLGVAGTGAARPTTPPAPEASQPARIAREEKPMRPSLADGAGLAALDSTAAPEALAEAESAAEPILQAALDVPAPAKATAGAPSPGPRDALADMGSNAERPAAMKRAAPAARAEGTGRIARSHAFMLQLAAAQRAAEAGDHLRALDIAARALASAATDADRAAVQSLIAEQARRFLADAQGHPRAAEIRARRVEALRALGREAEAREEAAALAAQRRNEGARKPASAPAATESNSEAR